MKPEIQALMDKQKAGEKLNNEDILALMHEALAILDEFNRLTQESIDSAHKLIAEKADKLRIAQSGRVLARDARGRRFEPDYGDQTICYGHGTQPGYEVRSDRFDSGTNR